MSAVCKPLKSAISNFSRFHYPEAPLAPHTVQPAHVRQIACRILYLRDYR